jgi:hypothetical protein
MRFQLILWSILAFNLHAMDEKSMHELLKKYDQVMDHQKIELIEEVFSKKFLKISGGKEEFIEKLKGLEPLSQKSLPKRKVSWKKGVKDEIYFVKVTDLTNKKSKDKAHSTEFIVIEEEGKLKIDGTISDGE